jgi:hypothetical protein
MQAVGNDSGDTRRTQQSTSNVYPPERLGFNLAESCDVLSVLAKADPQRPQLIMRLNNVDDTIGGLIDETYSSPLSRPNDAGVDRIRRSIVVELK